jgi:hypothetical protein
MPAPKKLSPARLKARRERAAAHKTCEKYAEQFGMFTFIEVTPDVLRRMESSLETGVDDFIEFKTEQKREHEEFVRAEMLRRATLNAPLLAPITPEKERSYTRLIKTRALYEGPCDLSWEQYFQYRNEHPEFMTFLTLSRFRARPWRTLANWQASMGNKPKRFAWIDQGWPWQRQLKPSIRWTGWPNRRHPTNGCMFCPATRLNHAHFVRVKAARRKVNVKSSLARYSIYGR